jgi:O-antigen biosynthesis protein
MINMDNRIQPVVKSLSAILSLDYASWLSHDILLLVGSFPVVDTESPEVRLAIDGESVSLEVRCISYTKPGVPAGSAQLNKIFTIGLPDAKKHGSAEASFDCLTIQAAGTTTTLAPSDLAEIEVNIQTLVRDALTGLDPEIRIAIMEFLALTPTIHNRAAPSLQLSKNLFAIREALRDKLPLSIIAKDQPQTVHVEAVLAIDDRSFYIRGWMRDAEAKIARLTVVSPEGGRIELVDRVFGYLRPDLHEFYNAAPGDRHARLGFLSYFELAAPSYLSDGWIVEMRNGEGHAVETKAPPVTRDSAIVRDTILGDIYHESSVDPRLLPEHIFPAISRLQEHHRERVEVESIIQYGTPNERPDVSIIVPLYGRIDFLEQQLAQFVHDPEIHQTDLIYVLDSPELAHRLRDFAPWLFKLYRIPFRVTILKRNAGFSVANNVGASLARGRLLLLLNSDILPDRPGWLGTMVSFYDSTPGIGALAPKLLYEDDSLQHAGLYFYPLPRSLLWNNEHYFKGLHRNLPAADIPRPVPAVTAACMMIDRELYHQIGSLRGIYVQGDYEDSDLCLRLIAAGYQNWYLPHAELYHLEGQSYPAPLRQLTGRYNAWLHTHLWNERIEAVMAQYASPAIERISVGS